MEDTYTVIYNGENLYSYRMTIKESLIIKSFREELINICDSLQVPRQKLVSGHPYMGRLKDDSEYIMKYEETIGYFVLSGERGVISLMEGFPTTNRDEAKFIILQDEFWLGGTLYELERRIELENEWKNIYSVKYDSRKCAFEYTIKLLTDVFKAYPEEVISKYTNYMNRWFNDIHWYYDKSKMSFEERH